MTEEQCEALLLDEYNPVFHGEFGLFQVSTRKTIVIATGSLAGGNYAANDNYPAENFTKWVPITGNLDHRSACELVGYLQSERAKRRGEKPPQKR